MRARLVVFPIKERNWCFSRSIDRSAVDSETGEIPTTLRDLWKKISSHSRPLNANAELLVDFFSNKMNKGWIGLEKAPEGTIKNKIYGLGLRLLARVKPSEIFLKSISKDVSQVEIAYPPSLNARLVRRRLRHVALRGTIIHRKYFYGSIGLLPLTTAFTVLPLPNIPFFWVLFRTYSHWQALQGSERLLQLVSDSSKAPESTLKNSDGSTRYNSHISPWILQPSEELQRLLDQVQACDGINHCAISDICKTFDLNKMDVLKYENML